MMDFKNIQLLILDVDGVLTDGKIYLAADGQEIKVFHTLDGNGIKMLLQAGIQVAIITGRDAPATATRVKQLGIQHYYAGVADKIKAFEDLLQKTQIAEKNCAYMGDDLPDLPVLRRVGLSAAPDNAHDSIKKEVALVTQRKGGEGAVRELCDRILSVHTLSEDKAFLA